MDSNTFLEAATKNKRGRPKKDAYQYRLRLRNENDEQLSDRGIQNTYYAEEIDSLLMEYERIDLQSFFLTGDGLMKRKGILEQLGRMMDAGLFDTEDALFSLIEDCITAYNMGLTSKAIERRLRAYRTAHKAPGGRIYDAEFFDSLKAPASADSD